MGLIPDGLGGGQKKHLSDAFQLRQRNRTLWTAVVNEMPQILLSIIRKDAGNRQRIASDQFLHPEIYTFF
jgi:hypothetical protein